MSKGVELEEESRPSQLVSLHGCRHHKRAPKPHAPVRSLVSPAPHLPRAVVKRRIFPMRDIARMILPWPVCQPLAQRTQAFESSFFLSLNERGPALPHKGKNKTQRT